MRSPTSLDSGVSLSKLKERGKIFKSLLTSVEFVFTTYKGKAVHISPVKPGFITYREVSCIYVFVVLEPSDLEPVLPPDPRNFDKFSWRMIQRQFYALHKNDLPFGVNLYFVLPKPKEGFTILEDENKVFADLLYQEEGEDYGKKIMSFVEIDTGKGPQLSLFFCLD